jgi:hypothetical protein
MASEYEPPSAVALRVGRRAKRTQLSAVAKSMFSDATDYGDATLSGGHPSPRVVGSQAQAPRASWAVLVGRSLAE